MARYFSQPRARKAWIEDEDAWEAGRMDHMPTVSDHEAVDTGLLDHNGYSIMRAPNPMGFGRDEEW